MAIQIPPGVFDILPRAPKDPWREVHLWQHVEEMCRQVAHDYGFSEIRIPMFERAELFRRSVGEDSDIVSKEMYVFEDLGGRELALRPEGTASVVRALVKEGIYTPVHALRYFYLGPMFRYERPQAGRFRQHHQFGVEVIGIDAPEQDAEIIAMLVQLYKRLGLPHLNVYINSLGDPECRAAFRKALVDYLSSHLSFLSEDSQKRFEKNPLRILDSKDPRDQTIVQDAPSILEFLNPEDSAHFQRVQKLLTSLNIPFAVSHLLVRGLDYYQRTVFEVTSGKLGAQNTVGAGGRYHGLIKQLGGPDLCATGYSTGLERIIQLLLKEGIGDSVSPPILSLVIIPLDDKAKTKALQLVEELRTRSVRCLVDLSGKKMKQAITTAVDTGAQWLLVLGEKELDTGRGSLKYLQDGSQTEVALDQLDVLVHLLRFRHEKD